MLRTPSRSLRSFGAGLLSLSVVASAAPPARAAGYLSGTKGARASGRAGAFVARADDLSAAALNPAGLSRLDAGMVQVGNRFSYNAHTFIRAPTLDWGNLENGVPPYVEFDAVHNEEPWQALEPLVGVASNLGLEDWGFALAAYAVPGIGRQAFPIDGGQRYMMVEREAILLNYTGSAAWRFDDVFALGATLQWIHAPRIRYSLMIDANQFPAEVNPVSNELDMLATVSGSDPFTLNAIIGAWYRPAPFLEFGISGQVIPTQIKTHSTLSVEPQSPELTGDVELRRDGELTNDVRLTLPLPLTARVGVRYRHLQGTRELFDVELDVGYESWSRVDRFTVDGDGLIATLIGQRVDVGLIEVEKQWRDTVSVHLGGDFVAAPELLTLRGGVFYESAVADRAYSHVDFVSGQQLGGALGGSLFFGPVELALAYEYRHQPTRRVSEGEARVYQEVPSSQCEPPYTDPSTCNAEFLGRPAPPVNAGAYRAHSHVASLDLVWRL